MQTSVDATAPTQRPTRSGRALGLAGATGGLALVFSIGLSAADTVVAAPARKDAAYDTDGRVKGEDKAKLEQILIAAAAEVEKDPAAALQACREWHALDPNNAMTLYVGAAAYAARKDWLQAAKSIEQGNALPACYLYVNCTGVARLDAPHGSHLTLFLSLARSSDTGGLEAMRAVRAMAFRVMAIEPRHNTGNVLVGRAMVLDADKALEAYHRARNEPATAAGRPLPATAEALPADSLELLGAPRWSRPRGNEPRPRETHMPTPATAGRTRCLGQPPRYRNPCSPDGEETATTLALTHGILAKQA